MSHLAPPTSTTPFISCSLFLTRLWPCFSFCAWTPYILSCLCSFELLFLPDTNFFLTSIEHVLYLSHFHLSGFTQMPSPHKDHNWPLFPIYFLSPVYFHYHTTVHLLFSYFPASSLGCKHPACRDIVYLDHLHVPLIQTSGWHIVGSPYIFLKWINLCIAKKLKHFVNNAKMQISN